MPQRVVVEKTRQPGDAHHALDKGRIQGDVETVIRNPGNRSLEPIAHTLAHHHAAGELHPFPFGRDGDPFPGRGADGHSLDPAVALRGSRLPPEHSANGAVNYQIRVTTNR
jgi:hypothetical protein